MTSVPVKRRNGENDSIPSENTLISPNAPSGTCQTFSFVDGLIPVPRVGIPITEGDPVNLRAERAKKDMQTLKETMEEEKKKKEEETKLAREQEKERRLDRAMEALELAGLTLDNLFDALLEEGNPYLTPQIARLLLDAIAERQPELARKWAISIFCESVATGAKADKTGPKS